MATETTKQTRNRNHNTALAFHSRRMKLSLKDLERITREPYDNLKNWRQGRRRTPGLSSGCWPPGACCTGASSNRTQQHCLGGNHGISWAGQDGGEINLLDEYAPHFRECLKHPGMVHSESRH